MINQSPHFNGSNYTPALDHARLANQLEVIREFMLDGVWRTLEEIEVATRYPQASISADLRHLRKPRFGSFIVQKRRRGEGRSGLYEYRVSPQVQTVIKEDSKRQLCFLI